MLTKEELKKIGIIAILIGFAIVFYHIMDNFQNTLNVVGVFFSILSPITIGFVIAYIINIPMKSVERVLFKKSKWSLKIKRIISLSITLFMVTLFFVLIFTFTIPQLVDSVNQLIAQIPNYAQSVGEFLSQKFIDLNLNEDIIAQAEEIWRNFLDTLASLMLNIANSTGNFISKFISGVFNAILSSVLAIYILLSKEQLKNMMAKLLKAFTSPKVSKESAKYIHLVDESFEHFIRGQMLEAIILGIICYIGMLVLRFEYPLLISVLVGITNIIPLFGPYIGAVPSVLLLLMVNPAQALWFILYVSVLQQIESNIIYPRVVGSSMGISGFWIIVAVVIGNSFFGIIGILLGIPLLSSIYVVVREITDRRLANKEELLKQRL